MNEGISTLTIEYSGRVNGGRMKTLTLFEKFDIAWLIRQVDGNSFPIFENRNRKQTLKILTDLQKQGFTTIRQTKNGITAE